MIKHAILAAVFVFICLTAAFAQVDFDNLYMAGTSGFRQPGVAGTDVPAPAQERGTIETFKTVPILDLLAERNGSSQELTIGATTFLATVVLDDGWDTYFQIRRKGSQANPGVWKETALEKGVTYRFDGGELKIRSDDGAITVTDSSVTVQTSVAELFDLLYTKSSKVELGGLVTYAMIRNFTPLTGNEGTITLRVGSDGLYYYSLTPDAQFSSSPRWLLAINGVLYGLRATDTDLLFVSKVIEQTIVSFQPKEIAVK